MGIIANMLTVAVVAQIGSELGGSHGKNGGIVSCKAVIMENTMHVFPGTNLEKQFFMMALNYVKHNILNNSFGKAEGDSPWLYSSM